jgi:hypothetical protein
LNQLQDQQAVSPWDVTKLPGEQLRTMKIKQRSNYFYLYALHADPA